MRGGSNRCVQGEGGVPSKVSAEQSCSLICNRQADGWDQTAVSVEYDIRWTVLEIKRGDPGRRGGGDGNKSPRKEMSGGTLDEEAARKNSEPAREWSSEDECSIR